VSKVLHFNLTVVTDWICSFFQAMKHELGTFRFRFLDSGFSTLIWLKTCYNICSKDNTPQIAVQIFFHQNPPQSACQRQFKYHKKMLEGLKAGETLQNYLKVLQTFLGHLGPVSCAWMTSLSLFQLALLYYFHPYHLYCSFTHTADIIYSQHSSAWLQPWQRFNRSVQVKTTTQVRLSL